MHFRSKIWVQDKLALETACLDASVCVADLIKRDSLGDAWLDGVSGQQAEESLQILTKPLRVARPHHVDRVEACVLAARQKSPEIQPVSYTHLRAHETPEHL